MRTVLVTGGAGFIGSHFVEQLLRAGDIGAVTVLDALTYAGDTNNLAGVRHDARFTFVEGNILDAPLVDSLVAGHDEVVHFAAESHVDRSFSQVAEFLSTNVAGTNTLLDAAQRHGVSKFVHVSTDEVYGPIRTGVATEKWPLRPTVPYAASKAASDLIALSYYQTFGLPVCVTRSSNNYGPRQFPEKLIPAFVTKLLQGELVPLHGDGGHVRNWLHVEDNCAGVDLVLRQGVPGEIYNIGGGTDLSTRELTGLLLEALGAGWESVRNVPDRRSNDIRYAIDWTKMADELGYQPRRQLADGLSETVAWYTDHWVGGSRQRQSASPSGAR
ncbi:dTDP-glucose 4,6-dehydratase [Kribbella sp. NPDC005582]|uniref:dTDP-glucose 4,6-dehydratase n=1 Tax=Kribbella sp. NPDC005582 TaxID=3156893 RepID=UPI0033B24966